MARFDTSVILTPLAKDILQKNTVQENQTPDLVNKSSTTKSEWPVRIQSASGGNYSHRGSIHPDDCQTQSIHDGRAPEQGLSLEVPHVCQIPMFLIDKR